VVKTRVLVAVLLFVPLFARAVCEEGAIVPTAAPPCHGQASDSAPAEPESPRDSDCCPACNAFVVADLSDPVPDCTSLPSPGAPDLTAPMGHRGIPVDHPPDASQRPLYRENLPLLT
jgi:hypothetical protein